MTCKKTFVFSYFNIKIFSISFLTIVTFAASAKARFTTREEEDVEVDISPKCAAVLLSGGALAGAGMVYAVTPTALCTAGFCPA